MPVISHPHLNSRAIKLKVEDDTFQARQPFSILGDPGAVSRDDAIFSVDPIFSSKSLLVDVNFRPKILPRPKISPRLTAPGSPRMTFQLQVQVKAGWRQQMREKILEPNV